jgi:hypothetical protein
VSKSICFVIVPFGKKPDAGGRVIDFDAVYDRIIEPAIADVGLVAIRADSEMSSGLIHEAMFERLILSEYAIAAFTPLWAISARNSSRTPTPAYGQISSLNRVRPKGLTPIWSQSSTPIDKPFSHGASDFIDSTPTGGFIARACDLGWRCRHPTCFD